MIRKLALLWLLLVLLAGGFLAIKIYEGIKFDTDLMALLPREERDPSLKHANDAVTRNLSRQLVILVGSDNRKDALIAANIMKARLGNTQALDLIDIADNKNDLEKIAKFYFPYRTGLLSHNDRETLREGKAQDIVTRALSQIYSFTGISNPKLLQEDPFLLLPGFFTSLPVPASNFTKTDGALSFDDKGKTWILISGKLKGEAFALETQKSVVAAFDQASEEIESSSPDVEILRTGAIFFAEAGSRQAMTETSFIGTISTIGAIIVLLVVFRSPLPIALSMLTLCVGILTALAFGLWVFGSLHVGALLFGVSLIGVAVDYSLEYCSEIFYAASKTPQQRLKKSVMGISLGTATTVIGYLTLFLAPFPGLKQVAAFSTVGLIGSWLTVVLWLPYLDKMKEPRHRIQTVAVLGKFLKLWQDRNYLSFRRAVFIILLITGLGGLLLFKPDDDVHHLQSLPKHLVEEQAKVQNLIGASESGVFYLVEGDNLETSLQREEALMDRLHHLVEKGSISGFRGFSSFVPSVERQKENRHLQSDLYAHFLKDYLGQVQLSKVVDKPEWNSPYLTEESLSNQPEFLSYFSLGEVDGRTLHIVMLDRVKDMAAVEAAAQGLQGVRLVNPVQDISNLLGKYRVRALILLALSAALMVPLLAWRYGIRHGLYMMIPPVLTIILTPGICALAGMTFTFFNAMALVLVLSLAVDYVIFCAESAGDHRPVTLLATTMTSLTTFLSFGLLILSNVAAVQSFGATMLIGTLISYILSPMAFKNAPDFVKT